MQLGPHFTTKKWNTILKLFNITPGSIEEAEFRDEVRSIFLTSFYEFIEKNKKVKLTPLRRDLKIQEADNEKSEERR